MRRNGRPKVTIEVFNRHRRVVQVRGRSNRPPRQKEAAFVANWATSNRRRVTAAL